MVIASAALQPRRQGICCGCRAELGRNCAKRKGQRVDRRLGTANNPQAHSGSDFSTLDGTHFAAEILLLARNPHLLRLSRAAWG